jgi:hypothetical protein
LPRAAVDGFGEQQRQHHPHAVPAVKFDDFVRHRPEMMHHVAALLRVPPAERFGPDAGGVERRQGALDLQLHPAVRERERMLAVNQDFHAAAYSQLNPSGATKMADIILAMQVRT